MAEKALTPVIQKACIQDISACSVDDLVKAMSMTGISKRQVSRLCEEIDQQVRSRRHDGRARLTDRVLPRRPRQISKVVDRRRLKSGAGFEPKTFEMRPTSKSGSRAFTVPSVAAASAAACPTGRWIGWSMERVTRASSSTDRNTCAFSS